MPIEFYRGHATALFAMLLPRNATYSCTYRVPLPQKVDTRALAASRLPLGPTTHHSAPARPVVHPSFASTGTSPAIDKACALVSWCMFSLAPFAGNLHLLRQVQISTVQGAG